MHCYAPITSLAGKRLCSTGSVSSHTCFKLFRMFSGSLCESHGPSVHCFYHQGEDQNDRLSSLPAELLHKLFLHTLPMDPSPTTKYKRSKRKLTSAGLLFNPPSDFLALGSCCKLLKLACDESRPSIRVSAEQLHDAHAHDRLQHFLQRLPRLTAVLVRFEHSVSGMHSSLLPLHTLLPNLTSLTLHCARPLRSTALGLASALLMWGGALQHLRLLNFTCPLNSDAGGGRWGFLSGLTVLKHLELHNVSPLPSPAEVTEAPSLRKLTLSGTVDCFVTTLDASSDTLPRELLSSRYHAATRSLQVLSLEPNAP